MPLSVTKRKGKEYLYYSVGGTERLYLGTADDPKEERIKEAINKLNDKIKILENEINKLSSFLPEKTKQLDMKYKIVIFDLDGIIFDKPKFVTNDSDKVAVSTWDVLFQELKIYNIHEELKHNFEKGIFKNYMEWTEAACNILKSIRLRRDFYEQIINNREFVQGVEEMFQILHKNKIITAVITGSFDSLAQLANDKLGGIAHIYSHCSLHFDSDGLLKSWKLKQTDYEHKASFVREIANLHGISLKECAYIGDDVNDLAAFKTVGLSIAFNSTKLSVKQEADVVIDSRDIRSILPLLAVIKKKA